MNDRILLDTNILVYSFDNKSSIKRKIAKEMIEELFENDNYFLSIQVLNEENVKHGGGKGVITTRLR